MAKIVDRAVKAPGKCVASLDTEGPFIDAGKFSGHRDPYVYLSVRYVEEVARELLGMVPRETVEEELTALETQIQEQADKLAALEHLEAASIEFAAAREAAADAVAGDQE